MRRNRIPSLDGARAISIALVMASHAGPQRFLQAADVGLLGVRVFFVISGFLITKLLLEERERTGRISIRRFYMRRAFRILPAAYVYIAIAVMLIPFGMYLFYRDVPPILLFYADYYLHPGRVAGVAIGQFWSLSVEEQFYFFWPAALVLLGSRRAPYACAILLLTAPTFRLLSAFGIWPTWPDFAFESVCDALATGCLLALLRDRLWSMRAYRRVVEGPVLGCFAGFALALTFIGVPVVVRYAVGIPLLNVSIVMLLDRYMRMPTSTIVGRILNAAPIAWVGTISYSLYLWQQPWMFSTWPLVVRVCAALACATISFYLVERPMLRLRSRILRGRSTPSLAPQVLEGS